MNNLPYQFHEDPAHGWLEVPRSDLKKLGIESQITGFSYQQGDTVYLEEDQDLTTFWNAGITQGLFTEAQIRQCVNNEQYQEYSFIRNLQHYDAEPKTTDIIPQLEQPVKNDYGKMTSGDYYRAYKFLQIRATVSGNAPFQALKGLPQERKERIYDFLQRVHQVKFL